MKAADFAIRHPAIIGICLITLALFGVISFRGMNRDLLANITTPEILVMTVYPGASPEVVERDVTDPLEEEFSLIEGISRIGSDSNEGYSLIFVTMDWEADLDAKKNDIRDRINNASSELPDGIDGRPRIFELGVSSLPVYTCLIESDLPDGELARILEDDIVPRLSRVQDVSAVYARGVEAPAVRVRMEPALLETMNITALEVFGALARGQAGVPAGDVRVGADRLALQSDGDWSGMEAIGRQPVGYTDGGIPVYVDDVAEVFAGFEEPEFRAYSGMDRVVALDVMKRPGGDTVGLVEEVRELQEGITAESGGTIRFRPVLDDAETIGITLSSVSGSAWLGGLLAVVVLLLFLHDLRAALIVTLAIPFTVFLTFILMRSRGMSLNIMTLAGITVSIGMVVDSSIVMLENTLRHRRMGQGAAEAASLGADEVGSAILASTSTSLSVFVPVLFVSGLAGAILEEVSWVLIFALASSALTAVFIVPWLSSRILERDGRRGPLAGFGRWFDGVFDRFAATYGRMLEAALGRKVFVVLLSAVLILASLAVMLGLGGEMFSAPDMNEFEVTVRLPAGYGLEEAEAKMVEIVSRVRSEVPEIESDLWYAGLGDSATIVESGDPTAGYGRVRLVRAGRRSRSVFDIVRHLNDVLPENITDAEITVKNGGLAKQMNYATDGAGFRVEISAPDWETVLEASEDLRRIMEADPLVTRTGIGVRLDRELLAVEIDREDAGRLGVDPVSAGLNLRLLFNGEEAGTLTAGGESFPIIVDSTLAGGVMPEGILGRLRVKNPAGTTVPFSAFSELNRRKSTDAIPHRDRLPSLVVTGELSENDLAGVRSRVEPVLRGTVFPAGVTWRITGAAEVMGDTFRELGRALAIAVFLVYAVMVIQFERFRQPFIIMGAVPFVLIGVALSMAAFGTKISMMTFFGVIALGGMVVNNAIVLVEFANQRLEEGVGIRGAVLDAARIRLKPILITTRTTVLGLIPLAFSMGEGSEIYAPLGQVIGGGLVTSTLITLVLIPVLYEAMENRRAKRKTDSRSGNTVSAVTAPLAVLAGFLLLTTAGGEAGADEALSMEGPWSVGDLTELATAGDPGLAAARADARGAAAQLKGAKAERGPVLELEAGTSYLSDAALTVSAGALGELPPAMGGMALPSEDVDVFGTDNDFRYDLGIVLEQPLFTWGKISSGIRAAEAGSAAAAWNAAAREDEVASTVRIACETLSLTDRMLDIAGRQQELGRRLTELTLDNYREGFLLETEYREARDRLQQIILAASSLERREKELLLALERSTGLDGLEKSDLILPAVDDSLTSWGLPPADELIAMAVRSNPELLALRSLEDMTRSELDISRGDALARPDIAFRGEFTYGGGYGRTPDDIDGSWQLIVGASATVFDSGRARSSIRRAEAAREAAAARVEESRRRVSSFIRSSLYSMRLNRENAAYYAGVRDTDAARAEERKTSWETGYGREEEWLLAELDRLSAELQRLGEVSEYIHSDRQVRAVAGLTAD